jgi:hypothetical protein
MGGVIGYNSHHSTLNQRGIPRLPDRGGLDKSGKTFRLLNAHRPRGESAGQRSPFFKTDVE